MSTIQQGKGKKKYNWAPYLLILPSLIYLAVFFAWPMVRGLTLAVWNDEAMLTLQAEASQESDEAGALPQGTAVTVLDQQGNLVPAEELEEGNLQTEIWYQVVGLGSDGAPISGWVPESRIRVREENDAGTPTGGSVRTKLGSDADPLTTLYAAENEASEVIGQLEARTEVTIEGVTVLEIWYLINGAEEGSEPVEGWAPSRYIQVYEDEIKRAH